MNGQYYPNPTFPNNDNNQFEDNYYNSKNDSMPMEQSYIENILRLNKGKKVTAYVSFPDSNDWRDSRFTGIIEEAGRDHLIISDPATGHWNLILMIYLNFVDFEERINYTPPYKEKTF